MKTSVGQWMFFVGILLTLMGLFTATRVAYNIKSFNKYPLGYALPPNFLIQTPSYLSPSTLESECKPYPQPYYDYGLNGQSIPRKPTPEELDTQKQSEDRCLQSLAEQRGLTKAHDIATAVFLLFTGVGLVFSRRFLE